MAGERRKARAIRKAQQKTSRWTWYMVALFSFAVALLIFSTFWTQYRSIQQSNAPQISTSKVLVISGHPDLSSGSTSNRLIISELSALAGDDMSLSVRHIPSLYPDGKIDVAVEQASLLNADVIVLQFPLFVTRLWRATLPLSLTQLLVHDASPAQGLGGRHVRVWVRVWHSPHA